MEQCSNGVTEFWNVGVMPDRTSPPFHYSDTPLLHHSASFLRFDVSRWLYKT
jgi:hypothetical protein